MILHQRHFKRLSERQHRLVEAWKRNRILYQTPHRMNDDWFWLYGALALTAQNPHLVVVSNDEARHPPPYCCPYPSPYHTHPLCPLPGETPLPVLFSVRA